MTTISNGRSSCPTRLSSSLDVARLDHITVGKMPEVELHRRLKAPFQRHLVDAPGGFAAAFQRVIHRGEEMVGRVEMSTVMRGDAHPLARAVFAIRKLVDA